MLGFLISGLALLLALLVGVALDDPRRGLAGRHDPNGHAP